ncbi:hypothetical protein N8I77_004770 [Diaporthe amygdali]|uniref:Protein kinase domain-containing protein n=1 Tax=Phomopsis amygdali TaxID=1214568 RepID=A0AAD9SMZ5_PHOAM|nr:hypothetical protein N8I77_004770 [Diaporthe amygdali]
MAELALGVVGLVGLIDVCHHWGTELVAACHALSKADTHLYESVVRVEACWLRTQSQIELVRHLDPLLDDWHRHVQQQTLEVLLAKLRAANTKLWSLLKPSQASLDHSSEQIGTAKAKRFKYVFVRDSLAEAIADLETWRTVFDPTWYLMMKMASPEVDHQLEVEANQSTISSLGNYGSKPPGATARYIRRAIHTTDDEAARSTVLLPADGLLHNSIKSIPLSPAKLARRADNGDIVILDTVTCTSKPHATAVKRDVRNFALRLKHADPFGFGLLQCKGILQEEDHKTATGDLSFVFRLPTTHTQVQSLRQRLMSGPAGQHDSLSGRLDLARQLVNAISYVHLYDFVHKNIRPETILIIGQKTPNMLGTASKSGAPINEGGQDGAPGNETAVLVGFDVLRDVDGKTLRLGDDDWERNLYRHPRRQGDTPSVDYEIRHDIYSLGVCLLEIGLWDSFVVYDKPGAGQEAEENAKGPWLGSGLGTNFAEMSGAELLKAPETVKNHLISLARGRLRRKVGTKYSKVVETCLTCLDSGNVDFGDETEFRDELGIAVGVRYIEKVVGKLAEIVV